MALQQNRIVDIIKSARSNFKASPKIESDVFDLMFNGQNSDGFAVSHESAEGKAALTTKSTYETTVNDIIEQLSVAHEDFKLTEAQKKAGRLAAIIASNPIRAVEKMSALKAPTAANDSEVVVSAESMNLDGFIPTDAYAAQISHESFDGQQLNNAVYYSIAYNIGAATQDEVGETIYPTITVSPVESGISVSVEYVAIMKEFMRNTNGKPVGDVENRIPVIKAQYDNSIFGVDSTAIIPVFRTTNKDVFVEDAKYVDDYSTPSAITTAPLKFGKTVDILGISQTDEQLAKGMMDNTDAVDRAVKLSKVYLTIPNEAGDATDLIEYDVSAAMNAKFTPKFQGHYKALTCNFKLTGASLNTSNTKTVKDAASDALGEVGANLNIVLQFNIHGDLNVESAEIALYSSDIILLGVRGADGKLVDTTDEKYTKAAAMIAKSKLVGYVLEARRTNTNVRTRGVVVSNEIFSYLYPVPYRSGVTCIKSLVNYSGTENDANRVAAQSQTTGFIISNIAVSTLVSHFEALRVAKEDGALVSFQEQFGGIGAKFVDAYYNEETIDLADVVDSLESNKRDDDVRANLRQRINNIAMDMIIESKYGPSFRVLKGNSGQKITIAIVTDPNIARLIVNDGVSEFDYGDRFRFKVVSNFNSLLSGKIFICPTVLDANKNTTPDPMNYGFCAYTPTIVYEVTKTVNGATSGDLNTVPRFLHVNNLPIGGLINVTDIANVFNKVVLHVDNKVVTSRA